MKITFVVAHDKNLAIGKDGDLPWHLPDDLKWFKKHTLNKTIVMGRSTWESLQLQPLPRRLNLVMTTRKNYNAKGAVVCNSMQEVLTIALAKNADELVITGGGEIFNLFLPLADELIVTEVDTEIENADTFFPKINTKNWFTDFKEFHGKDEKHAFDFTFKRLKRLVKT